ncbi:MAG: hypothetical protein HGB12_09215 [Bacteroidetes bacterium]|nr:hypothetical protein [Bacteroidota bacterium]
MNTKSFKPLSLVPFALCLFFTLNSFAQKELYLTPLFNDANLIAYWRLENIADSKGSYTLTNVNNATFTTAKINNGVNLVAASSQHLYNASTSLNLTGSFTYSVWFYSTDVTQDQRFFGERISNNSIGASMIFINSSHIKAETYSVSGGWLSFDGGAILNNTWYHAAFVKAADNEWHFFLNGVEVASSTASRSLSNNLKVGFAIGANAQGSNGVGSYMNGLVDDAAVFSRALSANEISSIYTGNWPQELYLTPLYNDANLVSYWRFEGNSNDSKGSNNGTDHGSNVGYSSGYGKFGQGVQLGATNATNYIDCGAPATGLVSDIFTVTLWLVKKPTSSGWKLLYSRGASGCIEPMCGFGWLDWGDGLNFSLAVDNAAGTGELVQFGSLRYSDFTNGDMITIVCNWPTAKCYINGVERGTATFGGSLHFTQNGGSNHVLFGRGNYNNCADADAGGAQIDDLAVFNRVLTTTEISKLFSGYAPTVTTPTSASITSNGALLGANVTSDGGPVLTARGTCWGTSANPTTNCVVEGATTTGVFTHARTGLPSGTFIYYRGYATNNVGTSYSADGTFTTSSPSPANVNWNNSNVQEITLAADRTFIFTNGKSGGDYTLLIKQNSTGGWSISWPANVKWDGGIPPVLNKTANAIGMVEFIYDGTNYLEKVINLDIK